MRCRKGENEFQPKPLSLLAPPTSAANPSLGATVVMAAPFLSTVESAKQHPRVHLYPPPNPCGASLQPCPVHHWWTADGLYPLHQLKFHWEQGVLQEGHFNLSRLELIYRISPRNLI